MNTSVKKYNAFSGVFTPSILTILGVIMYLRLGWVTAQAGLFGVLLIILLAHVISITTGLSISSIATDKRIKTGGIYYMLSRSLGLPMGGSIGITIAAGTALSISLYIVGFAENFLSLDFVQENLGLGAGVHSIRWVGTFVVILLTVLAFISTNFAIKTQFFIMVAIALSLISILLGILFPATSANIQSAHIPAFSMESFESVFAIFFPAVTGFTAGVAMSGDLKDPKRDIPAGTIASIAVGLVVYVGLAVLFYFFIDPTLLLNDSNFLLKVSFSAPLVIAGIWGATLSSALGGILGAPRIMQAIARDHILPGTLGKGYGVNNEPRNALIVIFLIAEAGILIGDLNIIARVVTMFYLAAYGFINLSFALEKWASSDFRPSFNISLWIGVIGFVASFFIMFQLDPLAMILAFAVLVGVYVLIRRRKLYLDFGDVWQSVRTSIMRKLLHSLDREELNERNWRPNILLFSGGSKNRPHLISFGKYLVGQQGFLSNFDLIEQGHSEVKLSRKYQSFTDDESRNNEGFFARRQTCRDIYEGIEEIASTYGFSGIEPNTVLLGWARATQNPVRFMQTLKTLLDLDLNLVLLDYDKIRGFGKYQQIDIWWRGGGNNGNLMLGLIKFIRTQYDWRNSQVRLLMVNPVNDEKDFLILNAQSVLDNLRMPAEIRVINNQYEQKPVHEIIKVESVNADLVFMGFPDLEDGLEKGYFETTTNLCNTVGTVALVKASSYFKTLGYGVEHKEASKSTSGPMMPVNAELLDRVYPLLPEVKDLWSSWLDIMQTNTLEVFQNSFQGALQKDYDFFEELKNLFEQQIKLFREKQYNNPQLVHTEQVKLLTKWQKAYQNYATELNEKKNTLDAFYWNKFMNSFSQMLVEIPEQIQGVLNPQLMDQLKDFDQLPEAKAHRLREKLKGARYTLHLKRMFTYYLLPRLIFLLEEEWKSWNLHNLAFEISHRKVLKLYKALQFIPFNAHGKAPEIFTYIEEKLHEAIQEIESSQSDIQTMIGQQQQAAANLAAKTMNPMAEASYYQKWPDQKRYLKNSGLSKQTNRWLTQMLTVNQNQRKQHINSTSTNLYLSVLMLRLRLLTREGIREANQRIAYWPEYTPKASQAGIIDHLNKVSVSGTYPPKLTEISNKLNTKARQTIRLIPAELSFFTEEQYNNFNMYALQLNHPMKVRVRLMLDYIVQTGYLDKISSIAHELDEQFNDWMNAIRLKQIEKSDIAQAHEHDEELEELWKRPKQLANEFETRVQERINQLNTLLSLSNFFNQAPKLRQYQREIDTRKIYRKWHQFGSQIADIAKKTIQQLWQWPSRWVLNKKQNHQSINSWYGISLFVRKFEALETDQNSLPLYYKKLFSLDQPHISEFFINRANEQEAFQQARSQYIKHRKGSLLISGLPYSGRSSFIRQQLQLLNSSVQIILINAPAGGATDRNSFNKALKQGLQATHPSLKQIEQLEAGSIVVLEDIELWWTQNEQGHLVIDIIAELIRKLEHQLWFIMVSNSFSLEQMNKKSRLMNLVTHQIEMQAVDAGVLSQIIMKRHKSSPYSLALGGSVSFLNEWQKGRYFNQLFNLSHGNIGLTIVYWKALLNRLVNQTIKLHQIPVRMKEWSIDSMNEDDKQVLQIFLEHTYISPEKLAGILGINKQEAGIILQDLDRNQIITEKDRSVYQLNPLILPLVLEYISRDT